MSKNLKIAWDLGNGEKAIIFNFHYNHSTESAETDITLIGNQEQMYHDHTKLAPAVWDSNKPETQDAMMRIIVDNLADLDQLPVSDEFDPEILEIASSFLRVVSSMKGGRVSWPDIDALDQQDYELEF